MKNINISSYIILIIFGMIVLAMRYTTPIINPWLYAEDGVWVANALNHGWLETFINAREDYFVFFNIFFLFVSTSISSIISGSPLLLLPQSIAVVSYFFYSLMAVMAFHLIIKISNPLFSILAYFITLLLPLGHSQSENIGHLLQIGFYMPAIASALIIQREYVNKKIAKFIIDMMIWLTAATNPVVFIIVGVYYSFKLLNVKNKYTLIKDMLPLAISMVILALFILPRLNGSGGLGDYGYNPNNIIEMVTARLLLYPFVFPWYEKLNDSISIALSFVYVIFCTTIIYKTKDATIKKHLLTLAIALFICLITTVFGRIGLSDLLNNYQITFPDRYFVGTNFLSILLFIACLSQCNFSKPISYLSYFISGVLLCIYIVNADIISESEMAKKNIFLNDHFYYSICHAEKIDNANSAIQIKPANWVMIVPTNLISEIHCH
ncbi:hypothetical protein K6731_15825 [Escherichia whittamii]|uniref:Glucosyl transferase GtrII n=2 Tax=Escherichia whittamii TaxID=2762229 RepID=A0ABR8TD36_9ESCH|nr:hypothetical protein [Escherichia whittamii]MCA4892226.1 hypothetical protein [Escherichia whittamii]